ncbi:MAG: bifunctional DNA primase/polymerase [Candidatus Binatia bacterium]
MNDFHDSALDYVRQNLSVIPARPYDKRPLLPWEKYQKERATEDQINQWWTAHRDANVAIVTGAVSDLVVIDVDKAETVEELKKRFPDYDFRKVPRSRTGRGWQLFFKHPGVAVPNRAGILPGLDVRGDGGYVVVPPSIHPNGKPYTWEVSINGELPKLPVELFKLISAPRPNVNGIRERFDTPRALAGVPEGQRDEILFRLACKLRNADIPQDMAERVMVEAGANCQPPFPERDALAKVKNAYQRYPAGDPENNNQASGQDTNQSIRIETLGDLWRKEIPKREHFLGEGLIARGDLIVFSGPQKKGKSLASLNQALCLARGESWFGFAVPKPIRVGIIQQEIPEGALKDRLTKMLGSEFRDLALLDSIVHCSRQGLKLDTKIGLDYLRRWLDQAKVDLLQLDPLYTFHSGDENSAKDMGRLFSSLQQIIREYSIAAQVIHHHGKPSQVEREGGDLHRGTSLLRDATDANWTFTRVPANKLSLSEPPSRYVYMGYEQRHSASPDPILLHLDPDTLWFERVEAKEVREVRVEEILEELERRDGECLQDDLIKAMAERLGAKERSTRDAIYEGRDKGFIEARSRGRKRVWKLKADPGSDVGTDTHGTLPK